MTQGSKWMRGLVAGAVVASALTVGLNKVYGSDHREAPTVDGLPEGDLTDVYAFTDPNDSTRVILIMNVNPFADSSESGSYAFSPDMLYQFKIDNTGDAREDLVIQIKFDQTGQTQTASVYGPSVPTATGARNSLLTSAPALKVGFGTTAGAAPGLIGYVGLRDDPFVFDFAQFTRILNTTSTSANGQDLFRQVGPVGAAGSFRGRAVRADGTSGVDGFAGFNVTSVAVSVPKTALRGSTGKLNIWATVSSRVPTRHGANTYQQFERQGQQAFSTIFVAKGAARDAENFEIPEHDVANYSSLVPDALTTTDNDGTGNTIAGRANLLTALGLTSLPNGAPLLLPATFGGADKNLLRNALLPDVIRLDLDQPITAPGIGFSPTAGSGGFPTTVFELQNGRTLDYSSIDVPLQLLRQLADVHFPSGVTGGGPIGTRAALDCAAFPACGDRRVLVVVQGTQFIKPDATLLTVATTGGAPQQATVGNDRPFLATFPYIAAPAPLPGDPGTQNYPAQQ